MGYSVDRISDMLHIDKWSETIFVEYMHTLLDGKQEASGYPNEVRDQENRERYIRDYQTNLAIVLESDKIQNNSANGLVSKICFNTSGEILVNEIIHVRTLILSANPMNSLATCFQISILSPTLLFST